VLLRENGLHVKCYGALAMRMIGCASPSTPILLFTQKICHAIQFHLMERSILPLLRSMDRDGALPVRSYALPNSLAVRCLS
jgi:hypothetical protein